MSSVVKIIIGVALVVASFYFPPIGIASFFGSLTLNYIAASIGIALITGGITQALVGKPKTTSVEAGKVNVRIAEPLRWLNCGVARQGGGVLFCEFDTGGNLWYLIVHSDSILAGKVKYFFDDVELTLDGAGNVTTNDFCLNDKKEPYTGSGTRVPYFKIWTTTYTAANPTPPGISALAAAFPGSWTSEHKLVGTTYSVVRCAAIKIDDRSKVYRWRGPIGLGEPALTLVGQWSKIYDPRDGTQVLGTPSTYKFSQNSALVWAWFRTHRHGRNKTLDSINWSKVAEQADICDQMVTGINGTAKRYECNSAVPDDKERATAEQEIMLSMDAQLVFDDDGRAWPRAGYYAAPTLSLSRNRDIVAMESVETQTDDVEIQGVSVRYIDPASKYAATPSAVWRHPEYYVPGNANRIVTVDVPTCQNHNQAMRLAKAFGMRSQPEHKLGPTTGLRGLRARQERLIKLNYDNTFSGEYEIITPVEVDQSGQICGFACVPVKPDRWTLLAGEEGPLPASGDTTGPGTPDNATGVSIAYNNGRIEADFDAPTREDVSYQFQYIASADVVTDRWLDMTVDMVNTFAYSGAVDQSVEYYVRWRAITTSFLASAWSSYYTLNPVAGGGSVQASILGSWIVEVAAGSAVVTVASTGTVTITNHTRRYPDGHPDVSVTGASLSSGLGAGTVRSLAYDDPSRVGGSVTYNLYTDDNDAHASAANPGRHYMGYVVVPATGSSGGGGGGIPGGANQNTVEP